MADARALKKIGILLGVVTSRGWYCRSSSREVYSRGTTRLEKESPG